MTRKYVRITVKEYEKLKRDAAEAEHLRGLLRRSNITAEQLILAQDRDPENGLYAQMYRNREKKKSA